MFIHSFVFQISLFSRRYLKRGKIVYIYCVRLTPLHNGIPKNLHFVRTIVIILIRIVAKFITKFLGPQLELLS